MSVKKQILSLCRLYSFYEGKPEAFLDETDVDSYFYHNIFDVSQSQPRILRVSRGSNKISLGIKLFQFCDIKTQQCYLLQERVNISKRELTSLVNSLRDCLKIFDQASKCIQIHLPKSKVEIGSRKSKNNLFAYAIKISFNIQIDKFVYHSDCETTIFVFFPSKSLNYTAVNLFLQTLSTSNIAKFTISTRTDITLKTSVKYLRAITISSAFTPDCGYDNGAINIIGTGIAQIQSVWINFACTKRLFNLLAEAIINVHNVDLCARCAIFLLKIKQTPFSCPLVKGFTFLKRAQNQFKMLLEMSFVLASIVSTERNVNLLVVI